MLTIVSFVLGNWRPIAIGVGVAAILAGLAYEDHRIFSAGQQSAIQSVEKANDQARAQAQSGDDAVRLCYGHGGAWDRDTGVCIGSAR